MKSKTLNGIHERLIRHVRSRYEMIKPDATLGPFNFRCFENAVEYARRYPEMEVIEVIYVDDTTPILHYINYDPMDKKYLETTLGWRAPYLEYYHIRRIHPDDYHRISWEFERSLDSWLEQFANWFHRKILRIERIL